MKKILIVIAILLLPGLCFAQYDKRGGNVDGRAIAPSTITADNGTFERVVVTDGTNTIELDPANSGAALNADSATIETLTVDNATVNDTLTFAENAAIIGKVTITGTGEAPASIVLDPDALSGEPTVSGPLTIDDDLTVEGAIEAESAIIGQITLTAGAITATSLTVEGAIDAETVTIGTGGDTATLTVSDGVLDIDEKSFRTGPIIIEGSEGDVTLTAGLLGLIVTASDPSTYWQTVLNSGVWPPLSWGDMTFIIEDSGNVMDTTVKAWQRTDHALRPWTDVLASEYNSIGYFNIFEAADANFLTTAPNDDYYKIESTPTNFSIKTVAHPTSGFVNLAFEQTGTTAITQQVAMVLPGLDKAAGGAINAITSTTVVDITIGYRVTAATGWTAGAGATKQADWLIGFAEENVGFWSMAEDYLAVRLQRGASGGWSAFTVETGNSGTYRAKTIADTNFNDGNEHFLRFRIVGDTYDIYHGDTVAAVEAVEAIPICSEDTISNAGGETPMTISSYETWSGTSAYEQALKLLVHLQGTSVTNEEPPFYITYLKSNKTF